MLLTGNQRAVSVQARRFSLRSRAMNIEPPSSGAAAHSGRAGRRHLTSRVASLAAFALALQIATASAAPDGAPVDASCNEKDRKSVVVGKSVSVSVELGGRRSIKHKK